MYINEELSTAEIRLLAACANDAFDVSQSNLAKISQLSQPTIQQSLIRIQEKLGFSIFTDGSGARAKTLTETGKFVAHRAKYVFGEIQSLKKYSIKLNEESK